MRYLLCLPVGALAVALSIGAKNMEGPRSENLQVAQAQPPVLPEVKQAPPAPAPEAPAQVPQQIERVYSMFEVVQAAYADATNVARLQDPEIDPYYIRYLDIRCVPKAERLKLKKTLDWMLNSFNTKYRDIVRTAAIPNEADPIAIRVNLNDYGIDPEAWDFLAEKGSGPNGQPDPFFHVSLEEVQNTFKEEEYEEEVEKKGTKLDSWGREYQATWTEKVKKTRKVPGNSTKKKVLSSAPWLALELNYQERGSTISNLIKLTNTKNPVLNGQWFVTYAGWPPAYWRLIGLKGDIEKNNATQTFTLKKGEKEFEDLVALDKDKARKSQLAAIADSKIVTLHNRILIRLPTVNGIVGGYYWSSFDTDTGVDDQDYMNNIANFDNPKIVAKEIIATAVNTLQVYAVADANGNLLSEASAKVAIHGDRMPTKLQDKVIYSGLRNCALCHNEGIIPIEDRVRDLAQDRIALLIADKNDKSAKSRELAKKIKDAFKPNLREIVKFDCSIHTTAVAACNGLSPADNKESFEDLMVDYYDAPITLEKAALEAGWPADQLEVALKKAVNVDYTVTSLLSKKVKPSRIAWERQGFAALMSYLLTQPQPK